MKTTSAGLVAAATVTAGRYASAKGANETVRVALIGCGGRGTHDAGVFQKTPNAKIVAVCDVDSNRRDKACSKLGL
ncbi:MAG TPA: gfo/Idh/MocA family oxidoreductase, partial [Pirellulales bacterium]|nr:gfo/Idh/MocA family oxidoreductase [Pirellulales bacterium]